MESHKIDNNNQWNANTVIDELFTGFDNIANNG